MLTNAATAATPSGRRTDDTETTGANQRVVIVNGSTEMLELLETVLDAGQYDIVFVESSKRAYSAIKRVRPSLVILCFHVDEMEGFQVLSMLKLDPETRHIPILTYASERNGEDDEEESTDASDSEVMFSPKTAVRMN